MISKIFFIDFIDYYCFMCYNEITLIHKRKEFYYAKNFQRRYKKS